MHAPRRPALEQPGPQLALLCPGELGDLRRVVGTALDQRQRLQHRVMDPGSHVGPFLGPRPRLPLQHQVAGDPQPPRPEQENKTPEDQNEAAQRSQQGEAIVRRQ